MKEKEYYNEIKDLAKKLEINKRARVYKENKETLETYWNIGKMIFEAQGGEARAKYGNELIEKWSEELTILYGKGYNTTNLKRFRQFCIIFKKGAPVGHQLVWTNVKTLLPIKDENKRNYYINLCIERNLSKRELIYEIKNKAYERLLHKPKKIEIIENDKRNYNIRDCIKDPILIHLNKEEQILKESDLQLKILSKLQSFFTELGQGYTFVDNEYKFKLGKKTYKIDILLFNYEAICFVVVELKLRELRKEDKAQIEFYMDYIDKHLKRDFHNKTIGIIVSKKQDYFIVNFIKKENIIPITYKLVNK